MLAGYCLSCPGVWLWRCLVEGECLLKGGAWCPQTLKQRRERKLEENWPESQRSGPVPASISAPWPLLLGGRGGRGGRRVEDRPWHAVLSMRSKALAGASQQASVWRLCHILISFFILFDFCSFAEKGTCGACEINVLNKFETKSCYLKSFAFDTGDETQYCEHV